jgi:hypothetical protein
VDWLPMLPGSQFRTFAAMRAVWNRHGPEILSHYVRQRPGTRPFALWALGELPLPPIKHKPNGHATKTMIEGTVFLDRWHYFGSRTGEDGWFCAGSNWGEFQHLRRLGVIDNREAELAEEWIDDREYYPGRDHRHYEALSRLDVPSSVFCPTDLEKRS